jgi:hypothetical protein
MKKMAAIGKNTLHNLGSGFPHHQFVSGDKRDDRVRVLLDKLDELGVDENGMSVEARKLNHRGLPFQECYRQWNKKP